MVDWKTILGSKAEELIEFTPCISRDLLHIPGKDWVDRIFAVSNRPIPVLKSLQQLFHAGRLGGTGYLNILPVDQGVEHSAGASFAKNIAYFDPEALVKLALEGGCSAIATTLGSLGIIARKYAHKIPFILKLNHNEFLSYPNSYDQQFFASVDQAWDMGCVAVGATIYFGSEESRRQIGEVKEAFSYAHKKGMATILWCYLRNPAFKQKEIDYHTSTDLTGQADYLGACLEADIVKQKIPTCNGGFTNLQFGKSTPEMYEKLSSNHPIDAIRYQLINSFAGRVGLINSGGPSLGKEDLKEAVYAAVCNKLAGGMGLIIGRKVFQKPLEKGLEILEAVQNVYLAKDLKVR